MTDDPIMQEAAQCAIDCLVMYDEGDVVGAIASLRDTFKADPLTGALALSHITQSFCLRTDGKGVRNSHRMRMFMAMLLGDEKFKLEV